MTKEERLAFLELAQKVEMDLPDGVEILTISFVSDIEILLFGQLNFRKFAEISGAEVKNFFREKQEDFGEYIKQEMVLYGCRVTYHLHPNNPAYEQELERCQQV